MNLPSPARTATALLTAATSYLTLRSWSGITTNPDAYLRPLLLVCLGLAVSGLVLRALRVPRLAVPLIQTALLALWLIHRWASGSSVYGWLPTLDSLRMSLDVLSAAGAAAQDWATPVPSSVTDFPPLLVATGACAALLTEILVGSARRVPLAGLPLIAVFTLPVSLLGGVTWGTFALAAMAFSLLLAVEQVDRLAHWGSSSAHGTAFGEVSADARRPASEEVRVVSTLPVAARIAAVGVGAAVLAPLILPAGLGIFSGGGGGGDGSGSGGPLRLSNPMLNLQRDLVQGADDDLVTVLTDDPDPSYLRLTVLDEFDGEVWKPSKREIPPTNQANGTLPTAPGLAGPTPRNEYTASMLATRDFESQWLPTPYPATKVTVTGDWRYDSETLDIVGSDSTFLAAEVKSLKVVPLAKDLAAAPFAPSGIAREGTALPDSVPASIEELAKRVTADADSDFERVVMLQDWFRTKGGFTYTLDRASGSGLEQLELFLGQGPGSRRGYCEQFAAAMAMMARSLDIPSRIAVGFLQPQATGPDRWTYSRRDLHAWPEIYFEGAGWTLFEPTPDRAESVPGYTTQALPDPDDAATPSQGPVEQQSEAPREQRRDDLVNPSATTQDSSAFATALPVLAGLALLAMLAATPRVLRGRVRRTRLSGTEPTDVAEGAWAELRATALDLDLGWDDGATLRQQGSALLPRLPAGEAGQAPDPAATVDVVVALLERARYSRGGLSPDQADEVRRGADDLGRALARAKSSRTQRKARWLPSSLWRARRINLRESEPRKAGNLGERDQVSL